MACALSDKKKLYTFMLISYFPVIHPLLKSGCTILRPAVHNLIIELSEVFYSCFKLLIRSILCTLIIKNTTVNSVNDIVIISVFRKIMYPMSIRY